MNIFSLLLTMNHHTPPYPRQISIFSYPHHGRGVLDSHSRADRNYIRHALQQQWQDTLEGIDEAMGSLLVFTDYASTYTHSSTDAHEP